MTGLPFDLRLGRWQDVLADVECDSLITDAPYGPRTHAGYRSGGATAGSISDQAGIIEYPPITRADAHELALSWHARTRKWAVIFGDHETWAWHAEAWETQGWYVFAPVPWIRRDASPRFSGDGPQRSAEWMMVARPRVQTKCGSLRGYYIVNRVEGTVNGSLIPGQKNLAGMQAVVRDYSRPRDTIVDPYAGTGTTLLAARAEGRGARGAEVLPAHYALARARCAAGFTPQLFQEVA